METVKDPLNTLASDLFGIDYLFTYQRLVISNILTAAGCGNSTAAGDAVEDRVFAGRDENDALSGQIVILPTGYGKSLCYMLPAALLEKPTVILSPLLSLIHDQARRLEKSGIPFSILTGSLTAAEKEAAVSGIASGRTKILITNPESLSGDLLEKIACAGQADSPAVSHIVIDEAHTAAEWGETFRPALKRSGEIIKKLSPGCVTAFTATATPYILERIRTIILWDHHVKIIEGKPYRSNIFYSVLPTICPDRDTAMLAEKEEKPLIIFCPSRSDTEITARKLRKKLKKDNIFFYHAGLEKEEKSNVEKWFFSSTDGILAATCAYGMGIDKPDIRTVIHRSVPQSVEAYLQESGRAGRDGKESKAILLRSCAVESFLRRHAGESRGGASLSSAVSAASGGTAPSAGLAAATETRKIQMAEYACAAGFCRREKLLSFFGSELPYCSGCDICSGQERKTAAGEAEIVTLVRRNNRKLKIREICGILAGNCWKTRGSEWYVQSDSFAALAGWLPDEIREGVKNLEQKGILKKGKYLWKGIYYL